MDSELSSRPGEESSTQIRKIVISSTIGTAMEWFDFIIYGLAAALVFNKVFFPEVSPFVGTLLAFASFGVGFAMRPLGAIVLGHFGDRFGRRKVLIITISGMGITTGLIGLLPPASVIGVAAPILLVLLRMIQGFSLGGEWSGATVMVIEHAPPEKRSRLQMFVQLGSPIGSLAATGSLLALGNLDSAAFLSWGWRIPFLLSFVAVAVAVYMRVNLDESPVFERARTQAKLAKVPLARMLRTSWIALVAAIMIVQFDMGGYYISTTFMTNYATATIGISRNVVLGAIAIGTVLQAAGIVVVGLLGDRYRPTSVLLVALIVPVLALFPIFWLVNTGDSGLATLGIVIGVALIPAHFGVMGVVVAQMFAAEVRYTGLSVAYNVGAVTGGLMPTISLALLKNTGSSTSIVLILVGLAAVSVVGLAIGRRIIPRVVGGAEAPAQLADSR